MVVFYYFSTYSSDPLNLPCIFTAATRSRRHAFVTTICSPSLQTPPALHFIVCLRRTTGPINRRVRTTPAALSATANAVTQLFWPISAEFLEYLTPSSLNAFPNNSSTLSVFMLPSGGILDDTMITRHSPDAFYIVTNAGRREEDLAYFVEHLKEWNANRDSKHGVQHEVLEGWGLVVFQGPKATEYLQGFINDPKEAALIGTSRRESWVGKDKREESPHRTRRLCCRRWIRGSCLASSSLSPLVLKRHTIDLYATRRYRRP